MTTNYAFFCEQLQDGELAIDDLYEAILRLDIIKITLDGDDSPQLIYESLNSTGSDLEEGDKIRNYIFMGLPPLKQKQFHEKYWVKIEHCTAYDVDAFVRDYLSVKLRSIPTSKDV